MSRGCPSWGSTRFIPMSNRECPVCRGVCDDSVDHVAGVRSSSTPHHTRRGDLSRNDRPSLVTIEKSSRFFSHPLGQATPGRANTSVPDGCQDRHHDWILANAIGYINLQVPSNQMASALDLRRRHRPAPRPLRTSPSDGINRMSWLRATSPGCQSTVITRCTISIRVDAGPARRAWMRSLPSRGCRSKSPVERGPARSLSTEFLKPRCQASVEKKFERKLWLGLLQDRRACGGGWTHAPGKGGRHAAADRRGGALGTDLPGS